MNLDLDAIKARADAASPGEWTAGGPYMREHEVTIAKNLPAVELTWDAQGAANAEFIAHAREDIPALLAEVRRLSGLLQSTYDALIQGGQTYYIRWKDAMTVLEGRKPGGVS